jgi:hypothetical protein
MLLRLLLLLLLLLHRRGMLENLLHLPLLEPLVSALRAKINVLLAVMLLVLMVLLLLLALLRHRLLVLLLHRLLLVLLLQRLLLLLLLPILLLPLLHRLLLWLLPTLLRCGLLYALRQAGNVLQQRRELVVLWLLLLLLLLLLVLVLVLLVLVLLPLPLLVLLLSGSLFLDSGLVNQWYRWHAPVNYLDFQLISRAVRWLRRRLRHCLRRIKCFKGRFYSLALLFTLKAVHAKLFGNFSTICRDEDGSWHTPRHRSYHGIKSFLHNSRDICFPHLVRGFALRPGSPFRCLLLVECRFEAAL